MFQPDEVGMFSNPIIKRVKRLRFYDRISLTFMKGLPTNISSEKLRFFESTLPDSSKKPGREHLPAAGWNFC